MSAVQPLVSLIVAMAQNGVIGRGNALPWRLPKDLKRFKACTLGKPVLMGRKTFESIGRALPDRANLVLTRDRGWLAAGVIVVHSVEEALAHSGGCAELVVTGGAEVYRLVLPIARRRCRGRAPRAAAPAPPRDAAPRRTQSRGETSPLNSAG